MGVFIKNFPYPDEGQVSQINMKYLVIGGDSLLGSNIIAALTTINRSSVPDLPDRLIADTAALVSVPIISRDAKLNASGLPTI